MLMIYETGNQTVLSLVYEEIKWEGPYWRTIVYKDHENICITL
jgi:hypothetical protein